MLKHKGTKLDLGELLKVMVLDKVVGYLKNKIEGSIVNLGGILQF
ncbi:hypothetical protein Q5M85_08260 [Paraclostridium bifermentans]|nr:hypothetical protein [Paraclostridium bifermentans]